MVLQRNHFAIKFKLRWQNRSWNGPQDPVSILRPSFPGMGIPMLKIRRLWDRLNFNMGIPLQVRWHLYIETAPWSQWVNPSGAEAEIFWDNLVSTVAADAVDPCITKSSATMELVMQNERDLVFHKEGFQLPMSYANSVSGNDENYKYIFVFVIFCVRYSLQLRPCGDPVRLHQWPVPHGHRLLCVRRSLHPPLWPTWHQNWEIAGK